ncbi:MAG TPA: hypothetical protein VIV60_08345 [Polyangiaceae bacterium]
MRPTLAPLLELPPVVQPTRSSEEFLLDFEAGALGMLAAIPDEKSYCDPQPQMFTERWNRERPSERLFLSFARADHKTAQLVKSTLEREGFVVFAYLDNTREPWAPLMQAGTFLRTAGVRLVIDSPAARASPGVWLEQRLTRLYSDAIVDFSNDVDRLKRQSDVLFPLRAGFWNTDDERIGTHINLLSRTTERLRQADRLSLPDNRVQTARKKLLEIATLYQTSDVMSAMARGTTPLQNEDALALLSEQVLFVQSLGWCNEPRCVRDVVEITRSDRLQGVVDAKLLARVQTSIIKEYDSTAFQSYLSAQTNGIIEPYLYGATDGLVEQFRVLREISGRFK